ncbi:MAG: ATP-binding protein [Bacteroidota bacterium]|nr:ATP-binding protein [Bacteroidota bacterium]
MKITALYQTVSLVAFITAFAGCIPVTIILFRLDVSPELLITVLLTTFLLIFVTALVTGRILVTRFYYSRLRELYKMILQFTVKVIGINIIPEKVTDTHLQEEILRLVRELETTDKAEIVHLKELEVFRREFLGNVSHELKTPIFTIQGYVHTLLEGGIEDQEINILYLQKAAKSIDRLISIVDDLESISKLEAGELILEHRTFDIQDLIHEVIESLELKANESAIKITQENDGIKYYVYADKDRIRQVLVNLVVNSVKYGKKGGQTVIKVYDHQDYVTVNVTDDGIGIEKQHVGRLFERFYRVDKSRSREQGGTGLGLAIVKHIIEAHGQKISVESTYGTGSTFQFTLKKSI